jgi:hypothetical protein
MMCGGPAELAQVSCRACLEYSIGAVVGDVENHGV